MRATLIFGELLATCALASGLAHAGEPLRKGALSAASMQIDILPGEAGNLVNLDAPEAVSVAVLGSAAVDVKEIRLESLRLNGASIVKDDAGLSHAFRDVNGDGRLDLVVQFAARAIQLGDADRVAVLEGATEGGPTLRGEDAIQTLREALRIASGGETSVEEKLPVLTAALAVSGDRPTTASAPLAILAGDGLDPRAVSLASIRVNGLPITRLASGDLASGKDVNGDGREDVLVAIPREAWEEPSLVLRAVTAKGRMVAGEVTLPGEYPATKAKEPAGAVPADKVQYPYIIFINDAAAASPYPATVMLSGVPGVVSKVRVTLNGLIHTCFNDLDVLLVAPNGQSLALMSDVGGCGAPANATNLTFDDFAPATLSSGSSPPPNGSYRPSNEGGGDSFPAPAPAPSGATSLSAFNGIDPNGEWKLYVVDDALFDTGQFRNGWTLDITTTTRFCNTGPISIPDGNGVPYPSTITVSGVLPVVVKATVTLQGLTHSFPDDLDIILEAPGTLTPMMLMSDTGGGSDVSDLQLTLDDDAAAFLPDAAAIGGSGAYRPTDYEPGDNPPFPAPNGNYSTKLRTLRGLPANGTWELYVYDDAGADTGMIARGWCIDLTTIAPSEACQPFPLTIPAGAPGTTSGPADQYPLSMEVTGTTGIPYLAEVKLLGLTHTYPDDLDIVVEGPYGQRFAPMSDAGGSTDVNGLDLRLVSAFGGPLPDEGPLGSGPYNFNDFEPGESLPAPAPAGPYGTTLPNLPANGPWQIWVADDALADVGHADGWCLTLSTSTPEFYCSDRPPLNGTAITIPQGAPGTTQGPASPYSSRVLVTEDGIVPGRVRLILNNFSHSFPDDVDVLLVGPRGQYVIVMSDTGGSVVASGEFITFDDEGASPLPDSSAPVFNGTYQPTNYGAGDTFPAPAPAGPYASTLSVFNGVDPQGYWDLYVFDDANGDVGSIASWCLEILPLFPAIEVGGVRWNDETTLAWDVAPNASLYHVLRGEGASLPNLLTGADDSCDAAAGIPQQATALSAIPPDGTFYWYLVVGETSGVLGSSGKARIGGTETAREADAPGVCVAP